MKYLIKYNILLTYNIDSILACYIYQKRIFDTCFKKKFQTKILPRGIPFSDKNSIFIDNISKYYFEIHLNNFFNI